MRFSIFICTAVLLFSTNASFAGDTAANFVLGKNSKGKNVTLQSYKGRVVYLDFWASWCPPCLKSFPWMNEMQNRYGKKGLKVIAVNMDQDRQAAKDFLSKQPADFHILYDPKGKIAEQYNVQAMPSAYFIDKQGNISREKKGFKLKDTDELEHYIQSLLGQ